QRALEFLRAGYRAIKLKIGRKVQQDIAHTAAVREAVGPDVQVMLDVNCAYEVDDAIELAKGLDGLNVAWLEEPIKPERPHDLARIREVATMPIATGENDYVLPSFEELVRCEAVDILQPNITRVGVTGMMAIGELCKKHSLGLAPHGVGSGIGVSAALHACCAAEGFAIYEANRLPNPLRDDIPVHPIDIRDGFAFLTDRPGHGCEIDWTRAAEYEVADGDISVGTEARDAAAAE
ncbi:MAG: mandelate racemase/muconate lactonizing enzyme family protein, partial [Oricola sp.]